MKTIKFLLPFLSASSLLFTAEGSFNREVDQPLLDAIARFDEAAVVTCLQNGANPNMDINPAIYDVEALDITVLSHAFRCGDTIFESECTREKFFTPYIFQFVFSNAITVSTEEQATKFESFKKIVKHLLTAGADVAAWDSRDFSPLRYALYASGFQTQWVEIVRLLCEHGANVHEKRCDEDEFLLFAAYYYNAISGMAILIEKGASVHASSKTLLLEACDRTDADSFKFFLKNGAFWNEALDGGDTLLHLMCQKQLNRKFEQKEIVTLLLSIARRTAQQRDRGLQGWLAERVDL